MGNSVVTATGAPAYVTGKVGTNAINLANTAGSTASQYINGTWSGGANFTISFWFNSQSVPTTGQYQGIFTAYSNAVFIGLGTAGQIYANMPSGGASSTSPLGNSSFAISQNTWYNAVYVFQTNGVCSFYVNNALIATATNTGGTGTLTTSTYTIGAQNTTLAFNGFIDDFRIYNSAVLNPSGAISPNPLVGSIMPYVYMTFEGQTGTDVMGNVSTTVTGSPAYVAGQVGSYAVNLTNTAGGTPANYVRGTISAMTAFTVSGWFNFQTVTTSGVMPNTIFSIGTGIQTFINFNYIYGTGLQFQFLNSSNNPTIVGTQTSVSTTTWYNFVLIYNQTGTCYFYLNNALIGSVAGATLLSTMTTYTLGSQCHAAYGAFNGYIDDFRIYNTVLSTSQFPGAQIISSPGVSVGAPVIYMPFENGSVLDVMGYSAVSARGTMSFVPGVVGSTAVNLVNPVSGTAVNYIRGSWAVPSAFTVSFWFNNQTKISDQAALFVCSNANCLIMIYPSSLAIYALNNGTGSVQVQTSFQPAVNTWYNVTYIHQNNGTCSLYLNNSLVGSYTNTGGIGTSSGVFSIGTYDISLISAFNGYIDDLKIYNCAVPFNALSTGNFNSVSMSASGQYQLAATANGAVYESTNYGSSWSQTSVVTTAAGQNVSPQQSGLAAYSWTQNGVNWTVGASTTLSGGYYSYNMFDNNYNVNNRWVN